MGKPARHPDPALYTRVRLVDEAERDVLVGQVGEVLLQSPALMLGYYRDPERIADARRGGWFHTGDCARQDKDGFFFFVDRKKDIIRRRGENIASVEIERVLNNHPTLPGTLNVEPFVARHYGLRRCASLHRLRVNPMQRGASHSSAPLF